LVAVGVTVIDDEEPIVVVPSYQVYCEPPDAVNVADPPVQIVVLELTVALSSVEADMVLEYVLSQLSPGVLM
jgi:hypothetical protein